MFTAFLVGGVPARLRNACNGRRLFRALGFCIVFERSHTPNSATTKADVFIDCWHEIVNERATLTASQ